MSDSLFSKDSAFKQEADRLANWDLSNGHAQLNFDKVDAHDGRRGGEVPIPKEAAGGKTLTAQQVKRLRVILSELDDVTEGENGTDALYSEALDILR